MIMNMINHIHYNKYVSQSDKLMITNNIILTLKHVCMFE